MSFLPDWMKSRGSIVPRPRAISAPAPKSHGRAMSGKYVLLYKYLENRYANRVVLTFLEIEDLLGFELPSQASLKEEWWTDTTAGLAGSNYSDSWTLASRTAVPNLLARTVVFDRVA